MEEYRQTELKIIKEKFTTPEGANDPDYDPHNYRLVEDGTNYFETLVHVINVLLGTGILAMPNAFKSSGLFNGFVLTLLAGILCTYGIHVVVKNQYKVCKTLRIPYITYPSLMRVAAAMGPSKLVYCGDVLEVMVDIIIIIFQLGTCTVYAIFVAVNVKAILDEKLGYEQELKIYMLGSYIPFLLMLAPPNLKIMAPVSLISNAVYVAAYMLIIYVCSHGLGSITERRFVCEFAEVPFVMGTILFSVSSIGSVMTVEGNMRSPKNFDNGLFGILNFSMIIAVFMYITIGFMGFWQFGDDTKGVITLNFDQKSRLGPAIQTMVSTAVYLSYGINAYVPVEITWTYIERRYADIKHPLLYNYIMRFLFVTCTPVSIPEFDLFIALSGALCVSLIQVIFPAILDICLKWPNELGRFYWSLILNLVVMLVGMMALVTGTYTSVRDLIVALKKYE